MFAALARGEAWSFPALRPHQREPWHAFTVQVAALALIAAAQDTLPAEEEAWRDLILALTPGKPEAWELVVNDWSKPALLQPPVVTAANRADYKNTLPTPDALDMLVTSRNHDVKQERMVGAREEDWLFALVTLQTTEGYSGAGLFGASRMNGGFASRMSLGVRPAGGGAAGAFRRDVERLVADARTRPDRRTGTALLWTQPWDGTRSLDFQSLDELYVDICRRVRLQHGRQGLEARAAGSKVARVAAAELKGKTDDPWAPIKADASSSYTPSGAGFGYRQMANLLDGNKVTRPLLADVAPSDDRAGLSIVAAALVRGQGKTEGLHRRAVRTSRMAEVDFGPAPALDRLGEVARVRADEAGEAAKRLRWALMVLVQGGPEEARFDDAASAAKILPWMQRYDRLVDRTFFDDGLWNEVAAPTEDDRLDWRKCLVAIARQVFDEAAKEAPRTEIRRFAAIARARTLLENRMKNWLEKAA